MNQEEITFPLIATSINTVDPFTVYFINETSGIVVRNDSKKVLTFVGYNSDCWISCFDKAYWRIDGVIRPLLPKDTQTDIVRRRYDYPKLMYVSDISEDDAISNKMELLVDVDCNGSYFSWGYSSTIDESNLPHNVNNPIIWKYVCDKPNIEDYIKILKDEFKEEFKEELKSYIHAMHPKPKLGNI